MSEIWITGDSHFGHSANQYGFGGIIFHAKRINPITGNIFSCIEEHDQFIIDSWNKTVSPKDTLIIAGDHSWRNHNHYIGAIHCKQVLVKGSHDSMSQDCLRNFTAVHEGMWVTNFHGVRFTITHCCPLVWESSHYNAIACYAHSHGRLEEKDDVKSMDVGVDCSLNYTPWNIDFIIYKMSLKKKQTYTQTEAELDAIVRKNKDNNIILLNQFKGNQ